VTYVTVLRYGNHLNLAASWYLVKVCPFWYLFYQSDGIVAAS